MVERNVKNMNRRAVPRIVTIKGNAFTIAFTLNEGAKNTKLAKNHPLRTVPRESRIKAFPNLTFSSPIGERAFVDGLEEKQKKTI